MILEKFTRMEKAPNEKKEIISMMTKINNDLECLHKSFDFVTDEMIIDSLIYEIMSLQKRYGYYLKLCKEKGFLADGFDKIS